MLLIGKLFYGRGGFASRGVSYEGGFIQKCTVGVRRGACEVYS